MNFDEARAYLEQFRDDGDENVADLEPLLAWRLAQAFKSSKLLRRSVRIESAVRTESAQRFLYEGWVARRPGFNLAANPDRVIAEHGGEVWRGSYHMGQGEDGWGHAVDVTRRGLITWGQVNRVLEAWGLKRTVPGEPWHYQAGRVGHVFAGPSYFTYNTPCPPYRLLKLRRRFSRGALVRWVQTRVGVTADGVFGPITKAAVIVWQRKWRGLTGQKLTADGIVGPKTYKAMKEAW